METLDVLSGVAEANSMLALKDEQFDKLMAERDVLRQQLQDVASAEERERLRRIDAEAQLVELMAKDKANDAAIALFNGVKGVIDVLETQ